MNSHRHKRPLRRRRIRPESLSPRPSFTGKDTLKEVAEVQIGGGECVRCRTGETRSISFTGRNVATEEITMGRPVEGGERNSEAEQVTYGGGGDYDTERTAKKKGHFCRGQLL